MNESAQEIDATGSMLADAAYERGDRLTPEELRALNHSCMWGSQGYPITRYRSGHWSIDHPAAPRMPLYDRKRDAVRAWEILLAKWRRMAGLAAYDRAMAERSAS